jgi:hypothetical protein
VGRGRRLAEPSQTSGTAAFAQWVTQTINLYLTLAIQAYNRAVEDTFPDIGSMSDQELKDLIAELTEEEREVSYRRRILHGRIDILRAELVTRLRTKREQGDALITGDDVQKLTDILLGKTPDAGEAR